VGVESDVEDESEDEDYDNEEEQLASMMQTIDELQSERSGLLVLNSELQKKAVALIAREKAMQGQTAAARTAAEVRRTPLRCLWTKCVLVCTSRLSRCRMLGTSPHIVCVLFRNGAECSNPRSTLDHFLLPCLV
jgi:hypothetical protein